MRTCMPDRRRHKLSSHHTTNIHPDTNYESFRVVSGCVCGCGGESLCTIQNLINEGWWTATKRLTDRGSSTFTLMRLWIVPQHEKDTCWQVLGHTTNKGILPRICQHVVFVMLGGLFTCSCCLRQNIYIKQPVSNTAVSEQSPVNRKHLFLPQTFVSCYNSMSVWNRCSVDRND